MYLLKITDHYGEFSRYLPMQSNPKLAMARMELEFSQKYPDADDLFGMIYVCEVGYEPKALLMFDTKAGWGPFPGFMRS